MRRLLTQATALGLLAAAVGCHTAGKCDCDLCGSPCCYGPAPASACCGDGSPGLMHGTGVGYSPGTPAVVEAAPAPPANGAPVKLPAPNK